MCIRDRVLASRRNGQRRMTAVTGAQARSASEAENVPLLLWTQTHSLTSAMQPLAQARLVRKRAQAFFEMNIRTAPEASFIGAWRGKAGRVHIVSALPQPFAHTFAGLQRAPPGFVVQIPLHGAFQPLFDRH